MNVMKLKSLFETGTETRTEDHKDQKIKKAGTAIPYSITAGELAELGSRRIPEELTSSGHLIYSSPATLAFNSPGAEGFGVKRAGLSIPGSVMLIVSPGCCGRNTSAISSLPGYRNRFFYLQMKETDLVSAGHLDRISGAVGNIIEALGHKPSVVMICITCVDALLATDMERVCRRAEKENGVRVRPCYMYALTREGRRPPMVYVRQSLYSLLEKRPRRAASCNLIGYFAPVDKRSELYRILKEAGMRTIRQISACPTYEEFEKMSEANFNLMLDPGARAAAQDMEARLGIPSIEIRRLYQPDKIHNQYAALGNVLGTAFDTQTDLEAAMEKVHAFKSRYPEAVFAIGECLNADPFELSLSLLRFGFQVREIYATVTQEAFIYIKKIADLSPETRIFSNLHPSMAFYKEFYFYKGEKEEDASEINSLGKAGRDSEGSITITIGKDAGYYHPDLPNVPWNSDVQPYGFQALGGLFTALSDAMAGKKDEEGRYSALIHLSPADAPQKQEELSGLTLKSVNGVKGFSQHLTPFAPDQSGAVSVLYNMGGLIVVCDAGGCTGNICGFDEPRWFTSMGRVFSAGLRDMDAIMGEDENLVEKTAAAADLLHPSFCAFIGTPVPAVIATDFRALRRMCEKKTGLPVISLDTTGMDYYDVGEEKAYLTLFRKFTGDSLPNNKEKGRHTGEKRAKGQSISVDQGPGRGTQPNDMIQKNPSCTEEFCLEGGSFEGSSKEERNRKIGVLGCTPMDTLTDADARMMEEELRKDGWDEIVIYGENTKAGEKEDPDAGLEALRKAADNDLNLVIAPAGLKAARYLQRTFGTPYRIGYPGIGRWAGDFWLRRDHGQDIRGRKNIQGRKILIVHQQVLAETLASWLLEAGASRVQTATFFKNDAEISALNSGLERECLHFESEQDFRREVLDGSYDLILADPVLKELIPEYRGDYIDLPHFALSGRKLL